MPTLIAVMAGDRRSSAAQEEMTALLAAHGELRGHADSRVLPAGEWGQVAVVGPGTACAQRGEDWVACAGTDQHALDPGADRLDFEGQFALARYEARDARLEVLNDALGMQALYVAERGGLTYVSTSALLLARHLRAPADPLGGELFLRTGGQFGPLTHWQGIERLDPATSLSWTSQGACRTRYWRPSVDERLRSLSFGDTVDRCLELARGIVARRLEHAPCLSADLTGGYDSRLLVALMIAARLPFTALTSGEDDSVDVRLAREVARAGGIEWRQLRSGGVGVLARDRLDEALAWGDGILDVFKLGEVLTEQSERSRSCDRVIAGGGGEHFGPYPWLQEFAHAGRPEVDYDRLLNMRVLAPVDLSVLTAPTRSPELVAYCRDALSRQAAPYGVYPNTTQLDVIYAYKSTGHFGAYRAAVGAHVRQEIPFYDRELFNAAFSAHHRWRNGHRLHRGMIERLNPAMARVATERGGPAMLARPSNAVRFAPYYARLARTAARKLLQRPTPPDAVPPALAEALRTRVDALREEGVLDVDRMRSGERYDRVRLHELVEAARAPDFTRRTVLGRIVTLELALRAADGTAR
jgi:Asparagine synthase